MVPVDPIILLVLSVPVALLVYITAQAAEGRSADRPVSPFQKMVDDIVTYGFHPVARNAALDLVAQTAPARARLAALTKATTKARMRFTTYGVPILQDHPHLVAYSILVMVLAAISAFFLYASLTLEMGLVATLDVASGQATVIGAVVTAFTVLIGLAFMEVAFPGAAVPRLRELGKPVKLAWLAGLGTAFLGILLALQSLATARADVRLAAAVVADRAACTAATEDPDVGSADVAQACAKAGTTKLKRDRAREWDRLVAVAAPVGEAAGSWALLRFGELAVAACLARAVRRRAAREARAAAEIDAQGDELVARLVAAATAAGTSQEDIDRWRRDGGLRADLGDDGDDDPPPSELPPAPAPTPPSAPAGGAAEPERDDPSAGGSGAADDPEPDAPSAGAGGAGDDPGRDDDHGHTRFSPPAGPDAPPADGELGVDRWSRV